MFNTSIYSKRGFDDVDLIIDRFGEFLSVAPPFDSIAVTGTSGMLVGPILAHKFNKGLSVVQKKEVRRHSRNLIDGYVGFKQYIIVDDFISSGETVDRIIETVKEVHPKDSIPELVAVFLYQKWSRGDFHSELINKAVPVYSIYELDDYPLKPHKIVPLKVTDVWGIGGSNEI